MAFSAVDLSEYLTWRLHVPGARTKPSKFFNSKCELIVEWMQKTKQKLILEPWVKEECIKRTKCGNWCRVPRWSPILIIYHSSDVQVYYMQNSCLFVITNYTLEFLRFVEIFHARWGGKLKNHCSLWSSPKTLKYDIVFLVLKFTFEYQHRWNGNLRAYLL